MDDDVPTAPLARWVRPALLVLAIPNLFAGIWGVVAPEHWFDNFPGWAPRLVAAIPPFNEHLATDAASGLFASGVVAAVAAWWLKREVIAVAMAAYLAFTVPHAMYHLINPAEALSASEDVVNSVTLFAAAALAFVVLIMTMPGRPTSAASEDLQSEVSSDL